MSAPNLISPTTLSGGTPVGGSGATNTIPRWTGPSTLGDSVITQDANARAIGVGVTPNASWPAAYRAIQLGQTAAWMAASGGANDSWLMSNSYWDGASFRYLGNGPALAYAHAAAGHRWLYSGSGSAGSAFSFTDGMILNTSGNVGIGTASPGSRVSVRSNTTSAGATPIYTIQANRQNSDTAGFLIGMDGNLDAALAVNGDSRSIRFGKDVSATFTEWGRFDSAGNFCIGTAAAATASSRLTVAGGFIAPAAGYGVYQPGDHLTLSGGAGKNVHLKPNDGGVLAVNVGATSCDMSAVSGYGLKLPATPGNTDPNTLDAYVDGGTASAGGASFTATLKGSVSDPTTPVTATGQYILVGKLLTLTIEFDNVTTTGAAGIAYITTTLAAALRPKTRCVGNVAMSSFTIPASSGTFADMRTDGSIYVACNVTNANQDYITHNAGVSRYLRVTVTYIIP